MIRPTTYLRIRSENPPFPGTKVTIDDNDWIVDSTEKDPMAVWKFMDWSEKIDGTGWEGAPSTWIVVLRWPE